MTRSKSTKKKAAAAAAANAAASDPSSSSSSSSSFSSTPTAPPSSSALIICRNKHWRYISSFHGPWLQLPPEVLQTLLLTNASSPRPRPIDPAVFSDLLHIRNLTDEAVVLSVRAHSSSISRERRHRMRELATQKLASAYRRDEIAASVAMMQSASSIEDVAELVLKRNKDDPEATYVHFFHEKIPSRMLSKCTSLEPLGRVVDDRPNEPATFRTRAITRLFKDDLAGAVADLTAALTRAAAARRHHDADPSADLPLSSMEAQLLFHRASTHLSISVSLIATADRKPLRTHAKRALRDYLKFLTPLDFSCPPAIHPISTLFTSIPPPASPDHPEALTYHPLLPDSLYSLLLVHILLSTPRPEIARHADTVARLCAIADGYPVFLAARSPARADWIHFCDAVRWDHRAQDVDGAAMGRSERAGALVAWWRAGEEEGGERTDEIAGERVEECEPGKSRECGPENAAAAAVDVVPTSERETEAVV